MEEKRLLQVYKIAETNFSIATNMWTWKKISNHEMQIQAMIMYMPSISG